MKEPRKSGRGPDSWLEDTHSHWRPVNDEKELGMFPVSWLLPNEMSLRGSQGREFGARCAKITTHEPYIRLGIVPSAAGIVPMKPLLSRCKRWSAVMLLNPDGIGRLLPN